MRSSFASRYFRSFSRKRMAKTSKDSFAEGFLKIFRQAPAKQFPPFEKLFGWPLPEIILPYSGHFAEHTLESIGVLQLNSTIWMKMKSLSRNEDQALDFFLQGICVYALLLGLMPFGRYKGDIHLVDVSDQGTAGEVFLHNHEVGLLEADNRSLPEFLKESYIECTEDDDHYASLYESMKRLKAATTSDKKKVKTVMRRYDDVYWLIDILRGVTPNWPSEGQADPKLTGVLKVHYELIISSIKGDAGRAGKAVEEAENYSGLITSALATRVQSNFAKPRTAKLGYLKAQHLNEILPERYGKKE
jgi:hypothetical protein